MGTKIFGASDDLIEFRGDVYGEVAHYDDEPAIIICSDASILTIKYGKSQLAIWEIALLNRGSLFDRIEDVQMKMRRFILTLPISQPD